MIRDTVKAIRRALSALCLMGLAHAVQAQTPQWTPPAPLNSYHADDIPSNDRTPVVATDGEGKWVALWRSEYRLCSATSTDSGATWSPFSDVTDGPGGVISLVYTGEQWVAHWYTTFTWNYYQVIYTTHCATSDDGLTWSPAEVVGQYRVFDVESDGAGNVLATNGASVLRSTDHGDTWTSTTMSTIPENGVSRAYLAHLGGSEWGHVVTYAHGNPETIYWYKSVDNGVTWSAPRNLSTALGAIHDLEANGNYVVAANYPGMAYSADGGLTWEGGSGTPYVGDRYQKLTVDESGNWLLVMTRTPFYNSYSPGNEAIVMSRTSNPASGWSFFQTAYHPPQTLIDQPTAVATGNGNFMLLFASQATQTIRPGPDQDIQSIFSTDSGASWSAASYVNDYHASDFPRIVDTEPQVVSGENGVVIAAWIASTDGNAGYDHVMFARSSDYGATWSNSAPATPAYGTYPVAFDSFQLLYAGQGRWMIWWTPGPTRFFGDYILSDDGGFTWSAPQTFFGHAAGSSHSGTMVKAHGAGGEPPVYGLARLGAGASAWEEPQHFENAVFRNIVHSGGNNWFVVTDGGELYVSTDDGRSWTFDADATVPPAGSTYATDHAGTVKAITAAPVGNNQSEVHVRTSTDNGATWSAPVLLASQSMSGPIAFTHASEETWLAAWTKNEPYSQFSSRRELEIVISRDNGETWSTPRQIFTEPLASEYITADAITADNGKAVVALFGYSDDVHYSFGDLNPVTGARDWQLFE